MNVDRIAKEIVQGLPDSFQASFQEWNLIQERIKQAVLKELQREPIQRLQVNPVQVAHRAATAAGLPTAYVHDEEKFNRVTSDAGKNIRLKDPT